MPAPLKGNAIALKTGFASRVQVGRGRETRLLLTLVGVSSKVEADARDLIIKETVRRLRTTRFAHKAETAARELAAATTPEDLELERATIALMLGSDVAPATQGDGPRAERSVREHGTAWTTGELARLYPAHIKVKKSAKDDAWRLEKHVYPTIGAKALSAVTLDDIDEIMRAPTLLAGSRRQVMQVMAKLFALAVSPCRVLEASPLPARYLPKKASRKAKSALFPSEEAKLVACVDVPLARRVLVAFCAREGMRRGEARALVWDDVSLDRGYVNLDRNKTNDPRGWALDPGVAEALRRYHRLQGGPRGQTKVFADVRDWGHVADRVREDLARVGVRRKELFQRDDARIRLRFHDAGRASFVTAALASGRSEAWVMERTGHTSSAQVTSYRRLARTFAEIGEGGWFTPMHEAIPELAALGHAEGDRPNRPAAAGGDDDVSSARSSSSRARRGHRSAPEPESGASANSATFAR